MGFCDCISGYTGNSGVRIPAWVTNTDYMIGNQVVANGNIYQATVDHTSGVFEDDLANGYWFEISMDLHYTFVQGVAASQWNIAHNLNKLPAVTIMDSSGAEVTGEVEHVDENNAILRFGAAFSGVATFN